ncbi:50S ribosomal protein L3, chloroplastic [Quillaja saponaria]|uniref:Large ribosomal subunit protein uL3c n=1 Tax=Quillaja saponaria TaxID=32244 RepID=A0AAD7PD77_QUISA|nr:50S ribosomal protein L3, chloroplastic [Quillaja saponaria]
MSVFSISSSITLSYSLSIPRLNASSTSSGTCSFLAPRCLERNPFLKLQKQHHSNLYPVTRGGRKPLSVVVMSMEAGIGVMATKLGMMSYFEPNGEVVPVTVVGYRRVRDRKLTKPELGHLQKVGTIPMRHLQEFRLQSLEGFEPNQRLVFDEIFKEGDLVDVSGTTIGKGFQGGIKRHHFKRGPMTHGSKSHRAIGSIGAGTTPGRVYKGKKMPGRMGGTKRKIRKLKIVKIDDDLNVIMIKGAVPGKPGNLLRIAPAKIVGKNIPKN